LLPFIQNLASSYLLSKNVEIETSFDTDQEPLFGSYEHVNEPSGCTKEEEVLD
jgi:hypothetical protein